MKKPDMRLSISLRLDSMIELLGLIGIRDTRREEKSEEGLVVSREERILGPRMMRKDQGRGILTREGKEEKGTIVEKGRKGAIEEEIVVIGKEEIEEIETEIAGKEAIVEIVVIEEIVETEAIEATGIVIATEAIEGTETTEENETIAQGETTMTERNEPIEVRNLNDSHPRNRQRRSKSIDLSRLATLLSSDC